MRPFRLLVAATLVAAALAVPSPAPAQGICGFLSHHPRHYAHVMWIWLENHAAVHNCAFGRFALIDGVILQVGLHGG